MTASSRTAGPRSGSSSSSGPKAAGALAGAAMVTAVMFTAVISGAVSGSQSAAATVSLAGMLIQANQACVVGGAVAGLEPDQAGYAGQIVSATFALSGESEAVAHVALMVAFTESGLHNLGPEAGDDGSLGLFQQRAGEGWGTPAEELDAGAATAMFVHRLLSMTSWSSLAPWVAAEDVQRSAFTGQPSAANGFSAVVGGNYRRNWGVAGLILLGVVADGNRAGACGQGVRGGVVGSAAAHGLPSGYSVPAGTGPEHAKVVAYLLAQLGKPYVWAAAGPDAFDCSGLTMAAWDSVGIPLDHYTGDQQNEGVAVTTTTLMAGDLVLVPGSDSPGPGRAGHVGIYLGYGLVLSAIDPQMGVAVQSWQTFIGGGLIALRDPDPADDGATDA